MKNLALATLAIVTLTTIAGSAAQAQTGYGNINFGTNSQLAPSYYGTNSNSTYGNGYSNAACPSGRCSRTNNSAYLQNGYYGNSTGYDNSYGTGSGYGYGTNNYGTSNGYGLEYGANTYRANYPGTTCPNGRGTAPSYQSTPSYQPTQSYYGNPYGSTGFSGSLYTGTGFNGGNQPYYNN